MGIHDCAKEGINELIKVATTDELKQEIKEVSDKLIGNIDNKESEEYSDEYINELEEYRHNIEEELRTRQKKRLIAFWRYDSVPYVLYGEVLKVREDGGVFIKGFDKNMTSYFTKEAVICIVPYNKGIKLGKKLDKAEKKYRIKVAKARDELLQTVHSLENINKESEE